MSALANDDNLRKLDGVEEPDYRRASRPFGDNAGFTIAESGQFVVLFDDALAVELGADVHGAVSDVFINADGYKKSISAPGAGNYITMAKAVASAKALLGDEAVRERSFIQAHGSSTPQNRVTESGIFDRIAQTFNITDWPVCAVKSYVGHSIGPASADQLSTSLGIFKYGIFPGVKTINKIADDVADDRLMIPLEDQVGEAGRFDVAFLNSKGFGGNNATACILSPQIVEGMLAKRYGEQVFADYQVKREATRAHAAAYDAKACQGDWDTIYRFGQGLIDESELEMTQSAVKVPGFENAIELPKDSIYADMI